MFLGGSIFSGFPRTFSFSWFSELSLLLLIAHMLFAFQTQTFTTMQSNYLCATVTLCHPKTIILIIIDEVHRWLIRLIPPGPNDVPK